MAITNNTGAVSFEGRVLEVYNKDYRAMSDVYTWATFASVWTLDGVKETLVNANFECDQDGGTAEVDATPETHLAVVEWQERQNAEREAREQAASSLRAAEELLKPSKGRVVEVFKGRKIPLGTTGLVFWTGVDNYGKAKLGIATTNRKTVNPGQRYASFQDVVWIAADNCRAVANQTEAMRPFSG